MESPRVYTRLDDAAFTKVLDNLFADPAILTKGLQTNPDSITFPEYIERHLPYTAYLFSLIYEDQPKLGHLLSMVVTQLLSDQDLRNNYNQLKDIKGFPNSIVAKLTKLDRETWLLVPAVGSHINFEEQIEGEHALNYSAHSGLPVVGIAKGYAHDHEIVRISTAQSPHEGQLYLRADIDASSYLPGGRAHRRLAVLKLLAQIKHDPTSAGRPSICNHMSLPIFSYTAGEKHGTKLLQYPAIYPDSDSSSQEGVCTLADFLLVRPAWWIALPRDEKRSCILRWMSCLASTVAFMHSLKVTHAGIYPSKIFIVKKKDGINIFLQDWHVKPLSDRVPGDGLKFRKTSSKNQSSFGGLTDLYSVQEGLGNKSPSSSTRGPAVPDQSPAAMARAHDVSLLGDVFGELVLVLIGHAKHALVQQKRERSDWSRENKNRDTSGSVDYEFYPKAPMESTYDTISSSATSETMEVKTSPSTGVGPETGSKPPSSSKGDKHKDRDGRPGSGLFGMFSKNGSSSSSSVIPTIVEPEQPKPKRTTYGISTKFGSMASASSGSSSNTGWWLDELRLMYPSYAPEDIKSASKWSKHTDFLGNHMLPLIAAMIQSKETSRPRAESVWKETCKINSLFFEQTETCCSYSDETLRTSRASVRETVLSEIYQRAIADEEEESWPGLGRDGMEKTARSVGRRGEGVVGECLFD